MSRLIAFGDSFTYGSDLNPKQNVRDPRPHPKSWPFVLGKLLDIEVINLAIPGFSNKGIWHCATHFPYKHDDIVIFAWSNPDRSHVLKTYRNGLCERYARKNESEFLNNHIKHLGNWLIDVEVASTSYYKDVFSEVDAHVETFLYMDHATSYAKRYTPYAFNVGIPHIDLFNYILNNQSDLIPPWFDISTFLTTMDQESLANMTVNAHLSIDGNESFAVRLKKMLDNRI